MARQSMALIRAGGLAAVAAVCVLAQVVAAAAQTLARDPDIEYALRQLAQPLVTAAGLSAGRIDVLVVQDDRMNAFVINDRAVYMHSGLILMVDSAAELQAVIAHELAHIANGHISRRMVNRRVAQRNALAGLAAGIAAGAATGNAEAGSGLAMGLSGGATRNFLAHTRAEEAAADASGLRYMAEAGIDPLATAELLDRFRGQEMLNVGRQDLYVRSHPLTRDRLRSVKALGQGLKVANIDQSQSEYWFRRAQGKLSAFIRSPSWTLRRVNASDNSDIAVMQRAIAYHRLPDPGKARAEINKLVSMRPNDPFVHELHAQILLETRDYAGAVRAYGRGAELAPRNPLILAGLGRAYLAQGKNDQALDALRRARDRDSRNPGLLRDLAVAYAKNGQTGQASLATAERYALVGKREDAALHAGRASDLLPRGSPGWRRAQDILDAAERKR